jgi:hypothetical protein
MTLQPLKAFKPTKVGTCQTDSFLQNGKRKTSSILLRAVCLINVKLLDDVHQ